MERRQRIITARDKTIMTTLDVGTIQLSSSKSACLLSGRIKNLTYIVYHIFSRFDNEKERV